MNQTFQNSAQVLSIGVFFTLMILGLASSLPAAMSSGLQAHGVPGAVAHTAARLPPVSILFAAFLGYNPIQHLLGATALAHVSAHSQAILAGRTFFPQLISAPFRTGLHEAFYFAIAACVVAAAASLMRGKPYYSEEGESGAEAGGEAETNGYRAAPVELRPRAREEQHAS